MDPVDNMDEAVTEELNEATCLELISPGGVGRLAYAGRFGLVVIPVNYRLHEKSIVFRTAQGSPMDEDLRTGIADAEYRVAFEIDEVDLQAREGWSVLIQGSAHHVESPEERASVTAAGLEAWRPWKGNVTVPEKGLSSLHLAGSVVNAAGIRRFAEETHHG